MSIDADAPMARHGRRARAARLLPIAGILAPLAAFAILAVVGASSAAASPGVTCGVSSGTVVVTVAGGSASDALVVTTTGGDFVVDFDGAQTCTSQTLSDSSSPTLQVKETPSAVTPTTFQPGTDAGIRFEGAAGAPTTFDLSAAPAATTIDAATGQATLGASATDTFSGINSYIGSSSGSTQFIAGAGGASFTGQGTDNLLSLSPAPASPTINAAAGTATIGTGTDTFTDVASFIGSNAGSTTFIAGTSSESFADLGSAGGDTVDFSGVATGPSTPLTVNLSGSVVNGQPTSSGVVGATTYSFSTGASNFSSFTGASTGSTRFFAGSSEGSFKGQGTANTLDLSAAPAPTTIDTSSGQATIETVVDTFTGFSTFVGSAGGSTEFIAGAGGTTFAGEGANNSLSIAPALASSTINVGAGTATIGTGTDTFTDVASFVGSNAGSTTFRPDSSTSCTFQGHGTGNTLDLSAAPAATTIDAATGQATLGASATDTFSGINSYIGSSSGSTQFIAGAGQSESFEDPGTIGEDSLDLSHVATNLSAPLTLNLTGGTIGGQPASTAVVGTTTYAFTAGDDFSSFVGSSTGNTDVVAGRASGFAFKGQGNGNTLDLSHTSAFVTLTLGQVGSQSTGGAGPLTLSGSISGVIGSSFGNHLDAGPGTVTLRGGSGADWLQAGSGTDTLDAGSGTATLVGGSGVDTMTGGTGSDTFIPGTGGGKISDTTGVGTLDFAQAKAAVRVNLGTKYTARNHAVLPALLATGGGGKPISLLGLTDLIGSPYRGDILRLGSHPGTITAGKGVGDQLVGSTAGSSTLRGGAGGDTFTSVGPNDHMYGGSGNDTFYADNGHKDFMNGGGGHNVAHIDCVDVLDKTFVKIQKVDKPKSC
jgi:hypothetical protein